VSDEHQLNYERFKSLINTRANAAPRDRDIRIFLENNKASSITFGYIEDTLEQAYGANIKKMFPDSRGFDSPTAYQSDFAAIPRAPFKSSELDSHAGSEAILENFADDNGILFFEQGFIASTASWFHAFDEKNRVYACLSYIYDDLAFYYMSEYENRLTQKLNSNDKITQDDSDRALALIGTIVKQRISKYNSQPVKAIMVGEAGRPKVLVVDQSYGDASTNYGLADDDVFQSMLLSAIRENPDSDIIVKTHPDTVYDQGKRTGYFTGLHSFENVYFFKEAINPYCLFDIVDKVYVGTSGVGMEALLAGKTVVCFGAPFYSGWGLTDDRQPVPHRKRSRSLDELFYYTYIWYTHYHTPLSEGNCEIEDVLDYVLKHRIAEIEQPQAARTESVAVSIITPVFNVEDFVEECILSLRQQTLKNIEIILINDASTDHSVDLIRKHMAADPRIILIDLDQNIGQGFARNKGISRATGEYILFIDADDFLYDDSVLEKLYSHCVENTADMARAGKAMELVENNKRKPIEERMDTAEIPFQTSFESGRLTDLPILMHNRHFWTFIYKRQFLNDNDIKFVTTQWEERPFLTKALLRAGTISDAQVPSIVYRVRQTSTARRAKSLLDVDRQLSNYEHTVDLYTQAIQESGHRLDVALQFSFSQILHSIFYGFVWKVLLDQPADVKAQYLQRIQNLLVASGLKSSDLTDTPINVETKKSGDYSYQYLFELARAGCWKRVPAIVAGKNIPAADVYADVLNGEPGLSSIANQFLKYSNRKLAYPRKSLTSSGKLKIILHIGSSKSGSTFLQHFCDLNRAQLLDHGIWYPEFGQFWQESRPHKQAGHSKFIQAAQKNDQSLLRYLNSARELFDRPVHTVLLSSEAFFLMDKPARLIDYLNGYDVSVLVYLRRQDEWANSQYCEFVAGGAIGRVSVDIEDWLKQDKTIYRMSYDRLLATWSDLLGKENLQVRRYGKQYFRQGELTLDFLHALGIKDSAQFRQPQPDRQNTSVMSRRHVQLMQHFNSLDFKSNTHYLNFVDQVEVGLRKLGLQPEQANLLPEGSSDQLLRSYTPTNDKVAKRYLHLDPGEPLFDTSSPGAKPRGDRLLDAGEISIFFEAYARCKDDTADPAEVLTLPPSTRRRMAVPGKKASRAERDNDKRYLADEKNITNRGYFRWRGRLKALFGRYASSVEPSTLLKDYYQNEQLYRQKTNSSTLRMASRLFQSHRSAYGVFEWRRQFTPLGAIVINRFAGPDKADSYVRDPIVFARKFDTTLLKLLGRLAYPMGEVRKDC
jgi:glycosyltransferase involved in cell wall biosynthesis